MAGAIGAPLPARSRCVGCGKEFSKRPGGSFPFAFKTATDPKTGLQRVVGDLCRRCAEKGK